jgi:glutaminyl-peptide cyclotransferase
MRIKILSYGLTAKPSPAAQYRVQLVLAVAGCLVAAAGGCKANGADDRVNPGPAGGTPSGGAAVSGTLAHPQVPDDAIPAEKTGGFDGKKAYEHVAKLVGFGPRPAGSQAILQAQDYITSQLSSYGCTVDTDSFSADTPTGRLPMKNIVAKVPGERQGIILLATHYDTKRLDNFVGADDGGSSTGVMLELSRRICEQRPRYSVWIAFFDGEEAVHKEWQDPDNRYGSRQMAAKMSASGDLKKVRAMILADIVGGKSLRIKREENSTKELTDVIWGAAKQLGYGEIFIDQGMPVEDDHLSFLQRGVPSADIIDLENSAGYWHTAQDTLDKINARSLGIVGHVILESVKDLQYK